LIIIQVAPLRPSRAHQAASELQEGLRQQMPEIADVVARTEP
jgi:hypothetical protein